MQDQIKKNNKEKQKIKVEEVIILSLEIIEEIISQLNLKVIRLQGKVIQNIILK